jgi:hypothetical protein
MDLRRRKAFQLAVRDCVGARKGCAPIRAQKARAAHSIARHLRRLRGLKNLPPRSPLFTRKSLTPKEMLLAVSRSAALTQRA